MALIFPFLQSGNHRTVHNHMKAWREGCKLKGPETSKGFVASSDIKGSLKKNICSLRSKDSPSSVVPI